MKTIQLLEKNAIKAFNEADAKGKELLINLLGKEVLTQNITDRVKTFEDACSVVGEDYQEFLQKTKDVSVDEVNYKKMKIIAMALNEGWIPDCSNTNQYKYYPWFKFSSGGGFSCCDCAYWAARTAVGARLCYKSGELAEYAGKQFINEYKGFLTL